MLSTWLSYADFERLVRVGLTADYVYEIVYGVSRNRRSWWNNGNAYRLGYDPADDAEIYAAEFADNPGDGPLADQFQGGAFVAEGFEANPARVP